MLLYDYEQELNNQGITLIAGLDEAGRGPLAGPLVVAGVIMPKDYQLEGLNDSKKLTAKRRELLFPIIKNDAIRYHIEIVQIETIDDLNIYQATKQAMEQIIKILNPVHSLTDAMPVNNFKHTAIIKGDSKSINIAAASILAKVTRDSLMQELDLKYPNYNFKQHKGYGTKEHINNLNIYGPCSIHRKTYEPIKSMLKKELS